MLKGLTDRLSKFLLDYLNEQSSSYETFSVTDPKTLRATLKPGDVLLVEGNQRISAAIKYVTQSTWSHAAFYVGPVIAGEEDRVLIEALAEEGVVAVPLEKYIGFNTRICRPVGLTEDDLEILITYMTESIGRTYDLQNVIDLVRYMIPQPPVPVRFRRRLLALGSGDPTRAICSTLIAQAFQKIRYPILPIIEKEPGRPWLNYLEREILHIRHHSLFTPRDFDISPYFQVIKPTLETGFAYQDLQWEDAIKGKGGPETRMNTPSTSA